jgi:hypothetical protein
LLSGRHLPDPHQPRPPKLCLHGYHNKQQQQDVTHCHIPSSLLLVSVWQFRSLGLLVREMPPGCVRCAAQSSRVTRTCSPVLQDRPCQCLGYRWFSCQGHDHKQPSTPQEGGGHHRGIIFCGNSISGLFFLCNATPTTTSCTELSESGGGGGGGGLRNSYNIFFFFVVKNIWF